MKKFFALLTCVLLVAMTVISASAADFATENGIIKDGLVSLHYAPQNIASYGTSADKWADLSGNGNDISLVLADNLSWKDNTLFLGAQGQARLSPNATAAIEGNAFTYQIEVALMEQDRTNGWLMWLGYDNSTGLPLTFYYHIGQQKIFVQSKNSEGANCDLAVGYPFEQIGGKILTMTYEVGGSLCLYIDDELMGVKEGVAAPIQKNEGALMGITGIKHINNSADRSEYKTIAVYNRALTEDEVIANVNAIKKAKTVAVDTTAAPITTAAPVTTAPVTTAAPAVTPSTADSSVIFVALAAAVMAGAVALVAKKRTF